MNWDLQQFCITDSHVFLSCFSSASVFTQGFFFVLYIEYTHSFWSLTSLDLSNFLLIIFLSFFLPEDEANFYFCQVFFLCQKNFHSGNSDRLLQVKGIFYIVLGFIVMLASNLKRSLRQWSNGTLFSLPLKYFPQRQYGCSLLTYCSFTQIQLLTSKGNSQGHSI